MAQNPASQSARCSAVLTPLAAKGAAFCARYKKPAVSHQSPPRVSAPKRVFLTRLALDRANEKFAFPKHIRRFGAKKFGASMRASMRKRDVFCIAQALFRVCAGSAPGRPRAALKNCLVIVWRAHAKINLVNFSD